MAANRVEPKGHICPPSEATHPSGRWECLFVYSFISKFTNLRGKVDGLETPMDFENSLLTNDANPVLMQILKAFVLNLRPQTRNLGIDQMTSTVSSILTDYFKSTSERSVFWDDTLWANVDPLHDHKSSFFELEWDLKLRILRQLVELQLCQSTDIKTKIDRAWGVAPTKSKKKEAATSRASDDVTQAELKLAPIGQDATRKRYWVADASPRVYVSSNPWKTTATFTTESSTKEEYMGLIERLKHDAPNLPESSTSKPKKTEAQLLSLIRSLEERVPEIDAEIARKERARRKAEARLQAFAQAELRETRTRRQTKKPDYTYAAEIEQESDVDNEVDEYKAPEDGVYDEDDDFLNDAEDSDGQPARPRRRAAPTDDRRRSTRTSGRNGNGKRAPSEDDPWVGLRDEPRRSTRFGGSDDVSYNSNKRARTEESTTSMTSGDAGPSSIAETANVAPKTTNEMGLKSSGAAALKPTEVAVAAVPGKKKSRFWVYAVEPAEVAPEVEEDDKTLTAIDPPTLNGSVSSYKDTGEGYGDVDMKESQSPPTALV